MTIETRIRAVARKKHTVAITRKSRSKGGFKVSQWNATRDIEIVSRHPNKKTAMAALLARLRCAAVTHWEIKPEDGK